MIKATRRELSQAGQGKRMRGAGGTDGNGLGHGLHLAKTYAPSFDATNTTHIPMQPQNAVTIKYQVNATK
ncbi:MAG: hypothetical protein J2P50_01710 [Hyphomicrobiaceae bacterium]|nr:hypothetical protein [Hyphomicrobiaceae bacterium]